MGIKRQLDSPNMTVRIAGLSLKNPVMAASGTFGYGEEYAPYLDLNQIGAIVVKGLSLEPRMGNPPPRIMETPCGMLNAVGLQNVGLQAFITTKMPFLRQFKTCIIVNIYAESLDEFSLLARELNGVQGVHALEVNISCPNVSRGGMVFGSDPGMAAEVTRRVKAATRLPVIVKLTPNVTDIAGIAQSVEAAGADAISLINTLTGMSVDVERRIPHLQSITGGLSGPAIKPVALRMVWQVVNRVSIPVVGLGGIMTAEDAMEYLIVGARAVQVGTANFVNPHTIPDVIQGIHEYLRRHNMTHIDELIGSLGTR